MGSWNDSVKVGIDIIDRDHHKLFDLIDLIQDEAAKKKPDRTVILSVIRDLRGYANTHFKREEALMIAADYEVSAFNPHRIEHEYFENLVKAVDVLYKIDDELINLNKLMNILREWLSHHIGVVDHSYVDTVDSFCKRFQH